MNYIAYKNTYSGKISHIITKAHIVCEGHFKETTALWDAGATHTHVTESFIKRCNLKTIGKVDTISHSGNFSCEKYITTIILPTNGKIKDITVLSTTDIKCMGQDIGVIIGMDIIQCGDFFLEHVQEKTVFTFRHSAEHINEELLIETKMF